MNNPTEQAAAALAIWQSVRRPNLEARVALFDVHGQYHGAFPTGGDAHDYVDSVADSEAWIGEGYTVVRFR